jgi:hypothetical protein
VSPPPLSNVVFTVLTSGATRGWVSVTEQVHMAVLLLATLVPTSAAQVPMSAVLLSEIEAIV